MINRFCENCGKKLDKSLICSACGTDYNEKPVCEHLFDSYMLDKNYIQDFYNLHLKCEKCNDVISLRITPGMLRYFLLHETEF